MLPCPRYSITDVDGDYTVPKGLYVSENRQHNEWKTHQFKLI